ncbi:hypothetical protein EDD11_010141 [Mortierella claussenii]|nr:hypothetical protein EDD11_010141 [Mortierella claussenii]
MPIPSIPSFPYFPPAIEKYSPELSPAPSDEQGASSETTSVASANSTTRGRRVFGDNGSYNGAPNMVDNGNGNGIDTRGSTITSRNVGSSSTNAHVGVDATPQSSSSLFTSGTTVASMTADAKSSERNKKSSNGTTAIADGGSSNVGGSVSSSAMGTNAHGTTLRQSQPHSLSSPSQKQQIQQHQHKQQNDENAFASPTQVQSHALPDSNATTGPSSVSFTSATSQSSTPFNTYRRGEMKTDRHRKSAIMRMPFPARAPPPPRSVTQLEEAMRDLKIYDSCLFWAKSGAVNLKPEGNSWDDDMVIQSKDPAWVRNSVPPPNPTNQELLILPSVAKIERSVEVFYKNSHLYPPFITPLIVQRAMHTKSNQVSRMLLNIIAGIAIRMEPDIENMSTTATAPADSKSQSIRYFNRAYGLLAHLEDNRSTYSTTFLQATLLLCYVYPQPQLRVELLKLMTEAIFLGLHVDASRWMPKPIVLQNRCWLFWTSYIFDSVHHVIRGQLTQMDDHYLDAPFPQLTELDHDDGLWTRWFMLKEINLWRIGRKIHSFFQDGLNRMDLLIENGGIPETTSAKDSKITSGVSLGNIEEVLMSSEHSEAELVLALKFWQDDMPPRLMAQLEPAVMDLLDSRVNGRAVGLQVVFSMLKVLLLYPSMLAIGTELLSATAPIRMSQDVCQRNGSSSSSSEDSNKKDETTAGQSSRASTQEQKQQQQQQRQKQHFARRRVFLDKIMQCVQEADRIVILSTIVLERYPERARMSCLGVALDWCLRIYYKIIMEKPIARPGESDAYGLSTQSSWRPKQQQNRNMEAISGQTLPLIEAESAVFPSRLKERCKMQVGKVARLLKTFEGLDHRHFFSWLTVDPESLEEHQKASRQRMIQKCLESSSTDIKSMANTSIASGGQGVNSAEDLALTNQRSVSQTLSANAVSGFDEQQRRQQQQQQQHQRYQSHAPQPQQQHDLSRPKSHDLQTIIRKRQQMGVYANSGTRPNGGNYAHLLSDSFSNNASSNSIGSDTATISATTSATAAVPSADAALSMPSSLTASLGVGTGISTPVSGGMLSCASMAPMVYSTAMITGGSSGGSNYPAISMTGDILSSGSNTASDLSLGVLGVSSHLPAAPEAHQSILQFNGYHPSQQHGHKMCVSGAESGSTVQPHAPVYSSGGPMFSCIPTSTGFYPTPIVINSADGILTSHQYPTQQLQQHAQSTQHQHQQQQHHHQQQQHHHQQQQQHHQHSQHQHSLDSMFD